MQIRNYTAATKVVGGTGGLIEDYIYKHGGTLKSHKQQSIRVSVNKVGWAIQICNPPFLVLVRLS